MNQTENDKKFLFISDSDGQEAKSRLAVAGVPYIKKMLESGSENWGKIVDIIETEPLIGVLVKLTTATMTRMLQPDYIAARDAIFSSLGQKPHAVFVHSSMFGIMLEQSTGIEESDDWFGSAAYFHPLDDEERDLVLELFNVFDLNVVPYRRNVELNLLAGEFVESHQSNLIFRFYIPSGKIYAEQTAEVLGLFHDYLTKSFGISVRQSSHATNRGTTYEFFGDGEITQEVVTARFTEFTKTMDLCIADPLAAEQLLISQGADPVAVGRIVTDYTKKLRRLTSDIRQERERKLMDIRHRLETELVEVASESDLDSIGQLVDQLIPRFDSVSNVPGLGTSSLRQLVGHKTVINIKPQFFNRVTGVVAQEVYGDQNIGPEPAQILELIRESQAKNAIELQSAVYELEDKGSSPEKRLSAGRRLQAFLGRIGGKLGDKFLDAGVGALQAYVQAKLGLGG